MSELERYRRLCEEHLEKTADGKFVVECDKLYCPKCGSEVRQDVHCCYCDECVNPDGGAWPYEPPLPLFYSLCLSSPKAESK